jgi:predicted ArsR family transcriptional regulator
MSAAMWSFFSNHGLALLAVARHPDSRIRDVAEALGITERAAQGILNDLVEAGYIERIRVGRRNRYIVQGERPLRHPTTRDHSVAELVRALGVKHLPGAVPGRRRSGA